jgi:hypothetical protein
MLTAYDFSIAKMVDAGGVDAVLVGDSASNVMAGHETTLANYTGSDDLSCTECSTWCNPCTGYWIFLLVLINPTHKRHWILL